MQSHLHWHTVFLSSWTLSNLHWSMLCSRAPRLMNGSLSQVISISQMHAALDAWMYAGMWGQSQSAVEKERERECCANLLQRPSQEKRLKYSLWDAWYNVLAFQIKMGRLKHFPDISWWLQCRMTNAGCQTDQITWPDRRDVRLAPHPPPLCSYNQILKKEAHVFIFCKWNWQWLCLMLIHKTAWTVQIVSEVVCCESHWSISLTSLTQSRFTALDSISCQSISRRPPDKSFLMEKQDADNVPGPIIRWFPVSTHYRWSQKHLSINFFLAAMSKLSRTPTNYCSLMGMCGKFHIQVLCFFYMFSISAGTMKSTFNNTDLGFFFLKQNIK